MPVIALRGGKGGVGTSLIAANLAVMLAANGRCLLVDLAPVAGGLDLLLGLEPTKSWSDLLPVANELTERHLKLATTTGAGEMTLLAAPPQSDFRDPSRLMEALSPHFEWLILDLSSQLAQWQPKLLSSTDRILLVTTLDPPALRASERWLASIPDELNARVDLVVNQWSRNHPVDPKALAASLDIQLGTVVPYSAREVSDQINYGRPIAAGALTGYGRAIKRLVRQLHSRTAAKLEPELLDAT